MTTIAKQKSPITLAQTKHIEQAIKDMAVGRVSGIDIDRARTTMFAQYLALNASLAGEKK